MVSLTSIEISKGRYIPFSTICYSALTAHIFHVMIVVTSGFSEKSFYCYFYFLEIPLSDLELVFLDC